MSGSIASLKSRERAYLKKKSTDQAISTEIKERLDKYLKVVDDTSLVTASGRVKEVIGSLIVSDGPFSRIGDMCRIYDDDDNTIDAEVIGFRGMDVLLASYDHIKGITYGARVETFGRPLSIMCSEKMLGCIINGKGQMLDGSHYKFYEKMSPVIKDPVNPLKKPRISEPIQTGVRAIDGIHTIGKGQRVAIMSGTGVGKSSLLSMIARNTNADVNVIALIGERRREVLDFIEGALGEEGLKRSVVVAATSDEAPLLRIRAAYVATAIAEYFRDQGKDVMFMLDSVSRFAYAQRDIGLSRGEPATTRGYTTSVFSELAQLLERTGKTDKGSITAFYSVLVEGDDLDEPITDAVRGYLDGHIILSRELANKGHYPAIDINKSISRLAEEVRTDRHNDSAKRFLKMSADYNEVRELIMIGGYAKGSMPDVDYAIANKPYMDRYLQQKSKEFSSYDDSKKALLSMFYSDKEIEEDIALDTAGKNTSKHNKNKEEKINKSVDNSSDYNESFTVGSSDEVVIL